MKLVHVFTNHQFNSRRSGIFLMGQRISAFSLFHWVTMGLETLYLGACKLVPHAAFKKLCCFQHVTVLLLRPTTSAYSVAQWSSFCACIRPWTKICNGFFKHASWSPALQMLGELILGLLGNSHQVLLSFSFSVYCRSGTSTNCRILSTIHNSWLQSSVPNKNLYCLVTFCTSTSAAIKCSFPFVPWEDPDCLLAFQVRRKTVLLRAATAASFFISSNSKKSQRRQSSCYSWYQCANIPAGV